MDTYALMAVGSLAFAVLGSFVIIWLFVRSRKREGIRPLEITGKDREQLKELRREFNIWRFSATLLGGFGGLALAVGIMSFFGLGKFDKPDWRGGVACFVVGSILILPAILVAIRDKLSK